MRELKLRLFVTATAFLTQSLFSNVVLAQDSAAGQSEEEQATTGIEDIVVTATRREARLQQVPVAVTALGDDALQSADVSTVRALTQVVPGFVGSRNMGVFQPVVRGVGSTGISIATNRTSPPMWMASTSPNLQPTGSIWSRWNGSKCYAARKVRRLVAMRRAG